jgi:hypothetical protein
VRGDQEVLRIRVYGAECLLIALEIPRRSEAVALLAELVVSEQDDQPWQVPGHGLPQLDLGALHYEGGKHSHVDSLPSA